MPIQSKLNVSNNTIFDHVDVLYRFDVFIRSSFLSLNNINIKNYRKFIRQI